MLATLAMITAAVFGLPAACAPGVDGASALVTVHGFKDRAGNLRIAIYPANEADFLVSGRYVQRLDTPMTLSGEMTVCAPVDSEAAADDVIVVALHDRDANGKLGAFRDGAGFSQNPKLSLSKPAISAVKVRLDGVTPIRIELNYMHGLRPGPVRSPRNR